MLIFSLKCFLCLCAIFRQFGQFDYSQGYGQGYGSDSQYMAPQQTPYNPTIMTPDQSAYAAKEDPNNFEDEPPLMEGKNSVKTLESNKIESKVFNWHHGKRYLRQV